MTRVRLAVVGVLAVASVSAAPAVAGAQTAGEDSVVGSAWDCTAAEPCEPDPSASGFVACVFERVAHGVPAFRANYGMAYQGLDAMERCIRSWVRGERPRVGLAE